MEKGGKMIKHYILKFLDYLVIFFIIDAILSWFHMLENVFIVRWIRKISDFLLKPIKRRIPPVDGIDFSPIVAIAIIYLLKALIRSL